MPGVLGVWTGADLNAAGFGPLKTRDDGAAARRLADEDADALLARHRQGALRRRPGGVRRRRDAGRGQGRRRGRRCSTSSRCPSVTDAREAAQPGAPEVFDDVPGNVCADYHYGDTPKVDEAFAKAAHVTRLRLISNRIVVCAMEPRSATAFYDKATDRYTFQAGNQGAFGLKNQMAALLGVKPRPGAHPDRQCRRLVRHEGLALSRICRHVPRLQAPRPAGEVDRRALGQLPLGPARPRPRLRRRAGARQGRRLPRRAAERLRQSRRLSRQCRRGDGRAGRHAQSRRDLPHAADRGLDQGRASPTPRRSAPIAAPAGPRPTTSWSG